MTGDAQDDSVIYSQSMSSNITAPAFVVGSPSRSRLLKTKTQPTAQTQRSFGVGDLCLFSGQAQMSVSSIPVTNLPSMQNPLPAETVSLDLIVPLFLNSLTFHLLKRFVHSFNTYLLRTFNKPGAV